MKLKSKFPFLMAAIGATVVAIFISTVVVVGLQKSDALIINLAGRQRMLSQKMAKEAQLCIIGALLKADVSAAQSDLSASRAVFAASLDALRTGGEIPVSLDVNGPKHRCPGPSPKAKRLLDDASAAWNRFSSALDKLSSSGFSDQDAGRTVTTLCMDLLKTSEATVTRMQEESEGRTRLLLCIQIAGILIVAASLAAAVLAIISMLGKLRKVNELMQTYGKGDLTGRVQVLNRADELDDTLFEVNRLGENIASIVGEIYATNTTLLGVSKEFATAFEAIGANADAMKTRSQTVAAAAEESSATVTSISTATEEMSATIATVATSMEEMSASINEVAKNCQQESQIAAQAHSKGSEAEETMNQLGLAAKEIGQILSAISDIAGKTRLLSLNATIEAASAGEAGKGFAVVANEVKQLSHQTADAAEEIRRLIESIQQRSGKSVEAIHEIVGVIGEINSISQVIVSSVKEQSTTAGEIARNIGQGRIAANETARNVSETAQAITQVSATIQQVSAETGNVADGIMTAQVQAKQLAGLGENLRNVVSMFRIRSAFIEWSDDLSIGINKVDEQHKKLIAMINDLNDAVSRGKAHDAVKTVLDGLADYAVVHFGMEENYFRTFGYPEYEGHKLLHDRFVAKVNDTQKAFAAGRAMINRDIMIFLKEWLIEHIMKTDRRYAPFLRKKGVV